jgi:hypothetical protein
VRPTLKNEELVFNAGGFNDTAVLSDVAKQYG